MSTDYSPLFYAASSGDLDSVRELAVDAPEQDRNRALAQAAALNQFECADALLELGADANGVFDPLYGTVLFPSCEYLNPEGISYLLRNDANPARTVVRVEGPRNALDHLLATHHRSPLKAQCIQLLLKAGAPDPQNAAIAIQLGSATRLQAWLEAHPDALNLPLKETYGHHPLTSASLLHMAAEFNQPELAALLLDHGMDINIRAEHLPGSAQTEPVWPTDLVALGQQTPLFHAKGDSKPMLSWLLDQGADPSIPGRFLRDGQELDLTPLAYFEEIDRIECNLLEETLTLRSRSGSNTL